VDADLRRRTLARFDQHRQAWSENEALRALYHRWYQNVREHLPPQELGPWVEVGSGPGLAEEVIPELELSDLVRAPWHRYEADAEALPFERSHVGALVLFDVLHHIPRPGNFFNEAVRVLRPGGRVVMCEPYVSALSFPVYRWLHEERCDFAVDPFGAGPTTGGDPFEGNQAIPTLLLMRGREDLERRFPELRVTHVEALAGPTYPASGGFSHRPLLPIWAWRALLAFETRLPKPAFRVVGFRLLAVLERR
jgi:SAM-dependent methyltransferase